jgi:hypothetical protein
MRKRPVSPFDVTFRLAGSAALMETRQEDGTIVTKTVEYRDEKNLAQIARDKGLTVGHSVIGYDDFGRAYTSGYRNYFGA